METGVLHPEPGLAADHTLETPDQLPGGVLVPVANGAHE